MATSCLVVPIPTTGPFVRVMNCFGKCDSDSAWQLRFSNQNNKDHASETKKTHASETKETLVVILSTKHESTCLEDTAECWDNL